MRRSLKNLIIPAAFLAGFLVSLIPSTVTFTYHRERLPSAIIRPETRQETARRVCKERLSEEAVIQCSYDLMAMAWVESRMDCEAVGDGGRSQGCFQIQTRLHGVSVEDARNFETAARWTLENLIENSYTKYRSLAISLHNGSGPRAEHYAELVKKKSYQLQNQ